MLRPAPVINAVFSCAAMVFPSGSNDAAGAQAFDGFVVEAQARQHIVCVLAEFRAGTELLGLRRGAEIDRLADDLDVAELGMMDRLGDAEMLDLRLGEGLVDAVDRPARHAGLVQGGNPLRAGLGPGDRADALVYGLAVLRAQGAAFMLGMAEQLRRAHGLAKALPQIVARGGDIDVAVGGGKYAGRDARGVVVAGLLGNLALDQPPRRLEVEHENLRLDQRGMHPLANAGRFALQQRDQDGLRQQEPRGQVGNRDADPHRALAGLAGDRHQPAHALGDLVHAGPRSVGTALAEACYAAIDDAWIYLGHLIVVDTQAILHVGAVIFNDYIGLGHKLHKDGA